jgi:hypothetical protein
VIVSAAREAPYAVGLPCPARQHDHRQIGVDPRRQPVGMAHPVEQIETVARLECEVQQNQTRPPHLDGAQALAGTGCGCGAEAIRSEVLSQKISSGVVVLYDKDQPLVIHASVSSPEEFLTVQPALHPARRGRNQPYDRDAGGPIPPAI